MKNRYINTLFKFTLCVAMLFCASRESSAQVDSLNIQEFSGELRLKYFLFSAPTNFDTLNVYLGEEGNSNARNYMGTITYSPVQHCFSLVLNNVVYCFVEKSDTINGKILSKHEVSFHLPFSDYTGERKIKIYLAKRYSSQHFIRERYF